MIAIMTRLDNAPPIMAPAENLAGMYYHMVLARLLDERMWALRSQGLAPFVISCQGHEGAQAGSAWALRPGHDWVFPYYRDLALVLTLGVTPREVMLGFLGKREDPNSGGRQMAGHYGHPARRLISTSSPVATQIPQAAGVALARRLLGEDSVTFVTFGDGATSKGDFHEGLNFASIHRLPVIFFCQNNGFAISTPQERQMNVFRVAGRAAAYGIPGVTVDGGDVKMVYDVTKDAVERARAGEGPTLIEALTVRLTSHSSDDDQTVYRSPEEIAAARERDPLLLFRRWLEARQLLDEAAETDLRARAQQEVEDATGYALAAPLPAPEELTRHVYAD